MDAMTNWRASESVDHSSIRVSKMTQQGDPDLPYIVHGSLGCLPSTCILRFSNPHGESHGRLNGEKNTTKA